MLSRISAIAALACAALLAGCSSYHDDANSLRVSWLRADFDRAEKIAQKGNTSADENDKLVWQLDFATTLRANGDIAGSQRVFDAAADTIANWDSQADVLMSKEIAAGVTNLNALPYRGKGSDRIMLQTYRALNFLENGQTEEARPALNAAFQAQSDALANHAREIAIAQEAAEKNSVDVEKLKSNPKISEALENERAANTDANSVAVYADYVNPFTTWLHGIYFMHAGITDGDFERAKKSLERVSQMIPRNSFVREDLKSLAAENPAANSGEITYVIFEYGVAPTLWKTNIDLLIPVPTGYGRITVVPIAISLPRLGGFSRGGLPPMSANGVPAQTVCDMRSVVKTDFENSYPSILKRTLITAFVKSAASAAANVATSAYANSRGDAGSALIAIGTMIGTSAFTLATSDADTRIWQTLPENYSIVRMKTPEDRRVNIAVGYRSVAATVPAGATTVVFVKSVSPAQWPIVKTFVLKK